MQCVDLLSQILREGCFPRPPSQCEASGYRQSYALLQQQTVALATQGSPLTSAMYLDLNKGAHVEVDTILGDLVDQGKETRIGNTDPERGVRESIDLQASSREGVFRGWSGA